jgi:hypothetical protein
MLGGSKAERYGTPLFEWRFLSEGWSVNLLYKLFACTFMDLGSL